MSDFLEKFFFSFSLFSLFSFFGGLLSARWKQPTVIGLLLVGMFIGPKFLGLVSDDQTINILSEFGIYLLLFSLGLEFSISNIFGSLIRILFSLFFILSIMFLIGYETSLFLFKDVFVSIFVGLLFSFSSTAVFSNHLKSCKKIKGVDFSFPAYILILQDLIAVVVLTVLISIKNNAFGPLSGDILEIAVPVLFPIFLSLIFFMLIYLILKNAINYLLNNFYHNIEDENVVLFVLGLTVLFSILAGSLGLSSSIGAFMAGNLISSLRINNIAQRVISPFSGAFTSYFFLSLGLLISPSFIVDNFLGILLTSILYSLGMFLAVFLATYLSGYSTKTAIYSASMLAAVSEFTLVIGRELNNFSNYNILSFFAAMLLFTTFFSSFLLSASDFIFSVGNILVFRFRFFGLFYKIKNYISSVFSEFEGKGQYMHKARRIFLETIVYLKNYALVASVLFLFFKLVGNIHILFLGYSVSLSILILIMVILLFLPAFIQLLRQLILFLDALFSIFYQRAIKTAEFKSKFFRNILLLLFFGIFYIIIPILFSILQIPQQLNFLNLIALFGFIVVLWDLIKLIFSNVPQNGIRFKF